MRLPTLSALALAIGLAAALALASCGGEDAELLPGETAREITGNLDAVERLADEGECEGAAGAAAEVGAQVDALSGVDPELKRALERGAARLNEVVATCEEASSEAVAPATEATTTEEETERAPPGQRRGEQGDGEDGERKGEPEDGAPDQPTTPEPTPAEPEAPPSGEGGGTGAPGGIAPAEPAPEGE